MSSTTVTTSDADKTVSWSPMHPLQLHFAFLSQHSWHRLQRMMTILMMMMLSLPLPLFTQLLLLLIIIIMIQCQQSKVSWQLSVPGAVAAPMQLDEEPAAATAATATAIAVLQQRSGILFLASAKCSERAQLALSSTPLWKRGSHRHFLLAERCSWTK